MNDLLSGLQSKEGIEGEKDVLGGGGLFDSNVYLMTIKEAYLTVASSKAIGVAITAETPEGRRYRTTEYVTSGEKKGCKNTYTDKNGKEHYLPGFNLINGLCLLTCAKELSQMSTEKKVVKQFKDGKEEPVQVDMLTEMLGKQAYFGIVRQKVNKTEKNDAGDWVPVAEAREENVLEKIFRERDKKTVQEIRDQVEEASFFAEWEKANAGKTRDRYKDVGGAQSGAPGAPGGNKDNGAAPQLFA